MLLGLRREGNTLRFEPCIPPEWPGYELTYREGQSLYMITVFNPYGISTGTTQLELDGLPFPDEKIPLLDDGQTHRVKVFLNPSPAGL
jgi:cellobiose phosphorylase